MCNRAGEISADKKDIAGAVYLKWLNRVASAQNKK